MFLPQIISSSVKTRAVRILDDQENAVSKGMIRKVELSIILEELVSVIAQTIINKRGREAATVYIIIYIPACSRSGW